MDVVVSLSLSRRTQIALWLEEITFRLMDEPDPAQNPNLDYVLMDAARLVRDGREEGNTVFCVALRCVAPRRSALADADSRNRVRHAARRAA